MPYTPFPDCFDYVGITYAGDCGDLYLYWDGFTLKYDHYVTNGDSSVVVSYLDSMTLNQVPIVILGDTVAYETIVTDWLGNEVRDTILFPHYDISLGSNFDSTGFVIYLNGVPQDSISFICSQPEIASYAIGEFAVIGQTLSSPWQTSGTENRFRVIDFIVNGVQIIPAGTTFITPQDFIDAFNTVTIVDLKWQLLEDGSNSIFVWGLSDNLASITLNAEISNDGGATWGTYTSPSPFFNNTMLDFENILLQNQPIGLLKTDGWDISVINSFPNVLLNN